jgi:hypothetical protein
MTVYAAGRASPTCCPRLRAPPVATVSAFAPRVHRPSAAKPGHPGQPSAATPGCATIMRQSCTKIVSARLAPSHQPRCISARTPPTMRCSRLSAEDAHVFRARSSSPAGISAVLECQLEGCRRGLGSRFVDQLIERRGHASAGLGAGVSPERRLWWGVSPFRLRSLGALPGWMASDSGSALRGWVGGNVLVRGPV